MNLCRLILVFVVLIGLTSTFWAQDKQNLQSQKQKIEEEIRYTNKLLQETKKNAQIGVTQIVILNNKIQMREKLINSINGEIYSLDKLINDNYEVIKAMEKDLEVLKTEYSKMIVHAYKNRSSYQELMFIFASNDFLQAYKRLRYIQSITRFRLKQAQLIQQTQQSLSQKINELEGKKTEKHKLLIKQEEEQQLLNKEKTEKQNNLQQLQKKQKELLAILKEKEAEAKKLQKAIEEIIAKEIEEASKKNKGKTTTVENNVKKPAGIFELTPEEQKLSDSFQGNKGKLPWPTERGIITSTYGPHPHPVLEKIQTFNNGIDIGTTKGSKARAVFDGKVTGVINLPGSKAVIIRHGEYLTVYSNLSETFVKTGDKVSTKQAIGTIQTNEDEGKTELHLEIWHGKNKLDPQFWLAPR